MICHLLSNARAGPHTEPPGWYALVDQETREKLFRFTVDAVQKYGGLTPDVLRDIAQKFLIDPASALQLLCYFTADVEGKFNLEEELERLLEEGVAEEVAVDPGEEEAAVDDGEEEAAAFLHGDAAGSLKNDVEPVTPRSEKRAREPAASSFSPGGASPLSKRLA